MLRPLHMAHAFLDEILTDQDLAVDGTMGNGHDTLFLAQRAGKVVAFDIQEQALNTTAEKLEKAGLTNAQLVLTGHESLDQFVDQCKAAIFNLGYLPSADKSVITLPETTLQAIKKSPRSTGCWWSSCYHDLLWPRGRSSRKGCGLRLC